MIYSEKVIDQMEVQIAEQLSEIDNLKDRIAELEKQSEPVAWIRSGDDQLSLVKEKDDGYMVWKPLYLAPQTKPLSDEEMEEVIRKHWNKKYGNRNMLTLCKAVLEEANK